MKTDKPDMPDEIWVFDITHNPVLWSMGSFCTYEPSNAVSQKYVRADLPAAPVQGKAPSIIDTPYGKRYLSDEEKEAWNMGYRTAHLASLSKPDDMQWQPIETAPMDGTKIIIIEKDGDVRCAFFANGDGSHPRKGWLTPWHGGVQPTHWIPMPPEIAAREKGE